MTTQDRLFAETIAPYSPNARSRLGELRKLILSTARSLEGVGEIAQALRWGQFSFLTLESGSGSTIRIDGRRGDASSVAIYFHCQSGLIEHFKELYPDQLKYEGQRAIVLKVDAPLPEAKLRHCISLALTHHLRKLPAKSRKAKRA
jgi:hypothetical protein